MVEIREVDGVAVVEMVHGKANALDIEFCGRLIELFAELERGPARAAVLTARGGIFGAGVDLKQLVGGGRAYARRFVPVLIESFCAAFTFSKPLIAAVNGHAVAGGCVLACAADRRLMAAGNGKVGIPELRVGVPFPAIAIEIMREVLSPERFRALVLGAGTLDPETARAWGLVDEVVERDVLTERAIAAAQQLAAVPADTYALTKQQMRAPALRRVREAEAKYGERVLEIWEADATLEAVGRYVASTLR